MVMLKFGAPSGDEGKILDATEIKTDGKGKVMASQTTPLAQPQPAPAQEQKD